MINQWLDYGDPALVKALEIRAHPDFTRDDILNQLSKSENSEKLLFSISSLLLGSFVFPWDNGIYRNLTSLILAGCTRVTVSELYHILTACSQTLALLELTRAITIEDDTRGRSKYAPVVLHSLKALNLGGVYPANLALLFSLIAIPNFHELDASLPAHEDGQKLLEKFFARCPQLATLYYESVESQGPDWLASQLFRSLPCVNNLLIVHGFRFLDEESTDEDLSESSAPHIPNLILLNCSLTFRVLSSLITKHRVQNLRLELCEIGSLHAGLMDHLRRSLNESFPTLKLTVSNEDSTVLYPIRQPRIWSLA
ncbi:hypothetical protein FRC09_004035 [Ceratobasidium sp. 395]|nr:hypothetical protein FRC09_004035 [Ceratobasidium sp. 395]